MSHIELVRTRDLLPLRIDSHQLQLLPASLDHVLDAEIKLAAHDNRVWLSG